MMETLGYLTLLGFYVAGYIPACWNLERFIRNHDQNRKIPRGYQYIFALFWPFIVFGVWIAERLDR